MYMYIDIYTYIYIYIYIYIYVYIIYVYYTLYNIHLSVIYNLVFDKKNYFPYVILTQK